MSGQKQEGARKICKDCNTQIICKRITFQGEERLSWRNPDGSAHFEYNEETKQFDHTPTTLTSDQVWKSEIEERLVFLERQFGKVWGE